ncbi:hypothetical protein AWW66_12750 [Micromonospora rosaria]|uniref:Oxygen sensor histidine kinase NreB n=1 Tax=Micromonospora rosaria TaxID=47874 RepID=A0A136PSZ7_9ACTN|nr:hypothetical protein AWW66_12750 [Micromonospora rosaria]
MRHPAGARAATGWAARFWIWDTYFAAVTVGVGALVALDPRHPTPARLGVLALFTALAGWYATIGRPLMRDSVEDRRGYLYLAGVLALYAPAVLLAGSTSFVLFALCPQVFMLLPALPSIAALLLLNSVHVVVLVARTADPAEYGGPALVAAMVVLVGSVLGVWSQRTVTESERRADLIAELDRSRTEVATLSHQAGITAERQRLAADIHDTIAQGLSSVVMLVQAADADLDRDTAGARRHLDLALRTARENLAEVRGLVAALTPGELTGSPLAQALHRLVDRFGRDTAVTATCAATGAPRPLATSVEVVLLRAAQEALANVRRHAGATTVRLRLDQGTDTVLLEVTDDGAGFTPDTTTGGYGLDAMRARVEQVHGTLTVRSAPGAGTTVRVEVPYP